jgi:endoglucanase
MKRSPLSLLQISRFFIIGWMLVWLSACGGSGGSSPPHNQTQAPVITSTSTSVAGSASVNPTAGDTVVFTTTVQGGSGNYAYSWDFGDSSEALAGQSVEHAYGNPNTYSVKLTVTDTATGLSAVSQFDLVVSAALSAEITSTVPANPVVGEKIAFTATANGGIGDYSYAWDLGDGSTATGTTANHTYAAAGHFTVTLTVKDSAGKTATATQAVTVGAGLGATITAPSSIIAGTAATFTGAGTGGTGTYSSYSWNFGDGTAAVTSAKPSHTFAATGTFTVTLTVKDSSGKTATATKGVMVGAALSTSFTVTPASPIAGVAATFTSAPTGGSGSYTYAWAFGDGGTSTVAKPSHTYAVGGPYTVTLTVKDSSGKTATASSPVTVGYPTLTAAITQNTPVNPDTGVTVSLAGLAGGGSGSYTYAWTFGDTTTSSGASVSHAYSTKGTYTVTLTVTDTVSNQSVQATPATVYVYAPLVASIGTLNPATPRVNQIATFSGAGGGGKAAYTAFTWDFGDGSTGSGASVTHTFKKMGPFTVKLTVTDSRGKTASATKTVTTTPIGYASGTVQYRGVNLSGAEWGSGSFSVLDSSYYPNATETAYFAGKNMNLIRFPFRWERLQRSLNGAFDAIELAKIKTSVNYALQTGQYVVLDQHNSARYAVSGTEYLVGSSQVPISAFADFWGKLAAEYKNEPRVMFGLTNEPHDMKTSTLVSAYNAAIVAIRAAGATNTVLVSGNGYSSASGWNSLIYVDGEFSTNATHMLQVVDSTNNIVFEAHQYLDSNGSGAGTECVSTTIGAERLATFTNWLKTNGKRGYLGEFGTPNTATCQSAVIGMLQHMKDNASVYFGWTWWAAGSKWDWDPKNPYILNLEPYSDGSDRPQMGWTLPYLQ